MSESIKFDFKVVCVNFQASLHDKDDVKLNFYLDSYNELNKFFHLMGTVFGFVSKDLKSKMEVLEMLSKNEATLANFETAKKMIEFEKQNALLDKKGYVSGSRTLLRLHRGLDFIRAFLKSIGELQNHENTGTVCREAYEKTLAHHHSFVVKNGAKLAMYTMPNREQLLKKVCGENNEDIEEAINVLPQALSVMATVFDRIECLYTIHDLHSLP